MTKDWTGNSVSTWKTLGASNHTDKERELNDFYATSSRALDLFAPVFPIGHKVWEPACGSGCLSKWLEAHGHDVLSTDLIDRGYGAGGVDFFNMTAGQQEGIAAWADGQAFDILTNPPYKYSTPFILKALKLIPEDGRVIMFLKTTFLEGKERKRLIYDVNPPRWVYQFSERILCAKNGQFDYMRAHGGSAVSYCFMVWQKSNTEKITQIKWI